MISSISISRAVCVDLELLIGEIFSVVIGSLYYVALEVLMKNYGCSLQLELEDGVLWKICAGFSGGVYGRAKIEMKGPS